MRTNAIPGGVLLFTVIVLFSIDAEAIARGGRGGG